jgi:hypothetical protein
LSLEADDSVRTGARATTQYVRNVPFVGDPLCFWDEATMARRKRWYNPDNALAVQVISRVPEESWGVVKWRHPRVSPGLCECLVYPLSDGPGLGLLVLLPPLMWVLSLPVFDVIAVLHPMTKADWALGLLIVPILLPMLFSFAMTFGYSLLFLGHMLVSSALGENDHPRWPEWHPADIAEGVGRWFWAALFGAALGGVPLVAYGMHRDEVHWFDWVIGFDLVLVGVGYAQMALAAALLHDNLMAANPVTVCLAIFRIGWAYLRPCLLATSALALIAWAIWSLLFSMPYMWAEGVALWGFWVFFFYQAMVVVRMLGLTYHAHALDLHWFRRRPKWATSSRHGQIYANS